MKIQLLYFTFLLLFQTIFAQNSNVSVEKLLAVKLLEKEDIMFFETYKNCNQKTDFLIGLYRLETVKFKKEALNSPSKKKYKGPDFYLGGELIHFETKNISPKMQAKFNAEISHYLVKLKSVGLINQAQFELQIQFIDANKYVHILQMLSNLLQEK